MTKIDDPDSDSYSDEGERYTSNEADNEKRRIKFIKKSTNRYEINLYDEFLNKIEEVYQFEVCVLVFLTYKFK